MDNQEILNILNNLNFSSLFWQICSTLIFIVADVVSGFLTAIINHNVDSQKMREGLLRKMLLVIIIILSFVAQYAFFNMPIISKFVCGYIIIMEIVSIFENLVKSGLEIAWIKNLLKIKNNDENTINLVVKNENKESEEK